MGTRRDHPVGVDLVMDEQRDVDDVAGSLKLQEGRRIRLLSCEDEHTLLRPGARGRVAFVDGLNTVHVDWDDGSKLGLIPGVDRWELDDDEE